AANGWKGLNSALLLGERHGEALGWSSGAGELSSELEEQRQRFIEAMDDDLNSSGGLAVLFELARPLRALANRLERGDAITADDQALAGQWQLLQELAGALGLATEITAPSSDGDDGARINDLIEARKSAKANKDYGEADRIRAELKAEGIELIDKPGGITDWIRA
ncbi:MAG TPA: cysteine--tRNA ligase, partial [Synechococcales bacterium UBA12195]|nr:cysteine--tRNA ligase [Synechococcales bacterium UBA12195]